MEPDELFDSCLENTVYRDKQLDARGVHLTVGSISRIVEGGQTDFGGDEQQGAETENIEPRRRAPDDDYGWWDLGEGSYVVEFNETVRTAPGGLLVVPSGRLLACGCTAAATLVTEGAIRSVLRVPKAGVSIKENARVALLSSVE